MIDFSNIEGPQLDMQQRQYLDYLTSPKAMLEFKQFLYSQPHLAEQEFGVVLREFVKMQKERNLK